MALRGGGDRVTTARLRADASQFIREVEKAALAAKSLDRSLGDSGGSFSRDMDRSTDSARDFRSEMDNLGRSVPRATNAIRHSRDEISVLGLNLGQSNNRVQALGQALAAIGPAAVPALAVAGAGVAALAGQLTFAVTGAGVAALAFAGVSDALDALNKVALDPSTANLEKLRIAMDKLGPAGQDFVVFLQQSRDELERLQNIAGSQFLPGVQTGITTLLQQMPQLEALVSSVSGALGDLAVEAGRGLASSEFQEFFNYLATDANQILTNMGHTIGLFVQAMASMLQAFQPLTMGFSGGLEQMARSFAAWAATLDENRGFQAFIAYVRDVTPQLLDTLGAIVVALADLAKSMSGIGPIALQSLEVLAKALSVFLETPLAPVILSLASAFGALATVVRVSRWGGIASLTQLLTLLPRQAGTATASLQLFGGALKTATGRAELRGIAGTALAKNFTTIAGTAGLAAGALSDFDDKLGLSNTLMFGSAGLLLGPWGGAVGAGVGQLLDLASANDATADAMQRLNDVAAQTPGDLQARQSALDDLIAARDELVADTDKPGFWAWLTPPGIDDSMTPSTIFKNWLNGDEIDKATEAVARNKAALEAMKETLSGIANATQRGPMVDYTDDLGKLQEIATSAIPVLDHMGLSLDQAQGLFMVDRGAFLRDFKAAAAEMDSMEGRTHAVATAVGDLDDKLLSTADSATTLSTAMDTLFAPNLNLIAARDALAAGLEHLNEELAKNRTLLGQSDAARQNRAAISALAQSYVDFAKAQAESGKSSTVVAKGMAAARENIIQSAVAAGVARKEVVNLLNTIGLTPRAVSTTFKAAGTSEAQVQAEALAKAYNKLPREVRVKINEEGGIHAEGVIKRVNRELDLTPKQRRILLDVRDNASVKVDKVKAKVRDLDHTKAFPDIDLDSGAFIRKSDLALDNLDKLSKQKSIPKLDVDATEAQSKIDHTNAMLDRYDGQKVDATLSADDQASRLIDLVLARLSRVDGYTATSTINVVTVESTRRRAKGGPAWGPVRGPGGPTDDLAGLYALSNNEFVHRAAATNYYGMDAMYAINDMRADRDALRKAIGLASGGLAGLSSIQIPGLAGGGVPPRKRGDRLTGSDVFARTLRDPILSLEDIARALHEMRDEARDVVRAERDLRRERERSKDLDRQVREAERGDGEASKHLLEQQRKQAKALGDAEKELSRQRSELSEATSKLRDREKELLAQAQAISDAVTQQGAIFGGNGTSVTAQGILSKLRHSVADAVQFREDIAILRGRNLDETLIQQLLAEGSTPEGVQAVHNLAESSRRMFKRINAQQQKLERVGASVGAWGVGGGGGNGGGGLSVTYGDITTVDFESFNRKNVRNIRRAVRRARQP